MKRVAFIISMILLSVFLVSSVFAVSIEPDVVSALKTEESVPVIVTLKQDAKAVSIAAIEEKQEQVLEKLDVTEGVGDSDGNFDLEHQFTVINGFSGNATPEAIAILAKDKNVASIEYDRPIRLFLSTSGPQIGATTVHSVSVNGEMMNGTGETVCIIDTGVDYTHASLGGCSLTSVQDGSCPVVIGGVDLANNDTDPIDTNGHGTHVAGIVASRHNTYTGIAPGAKIVAVKVFADGSSTTSESTVIAGIDWCRTQAATQNISVISLSLGDNVRHTSTCDTDTLAAAANNAVASGLFVGVASGNNGFSDGLTSPACASNVTSVGSVNSLDAVSSFTNSASFLDLLAPGNLIKSLKVGSGLATYSGTSMAAPHVAGSAALVRQYWRTVYGITPTVQQIQQKLQATGKPVTDTRNGLTFSRVDLAAAIKPVISLASNTLVNGTVTRNQSVFVNMTSDVHLNSALLQWNYGNGTVINLTMDSLTTTQFSYTLNGLSGGNYTYTVFGNDSANTLGVSEQRTIFVDVNAPMITVAAPVSSVNYSAVFSLNVSVSDQFTLSSSNYSIFNSSGASVRSRENTTITAEVFSWSDLINVTNSTFPDGDYNLTIAAEDVAGNTLTTSTLFTVFNNAPTNITLTPVAGTVLEVGEETSFTATAVDYEQDSLSYSWDFADGSSAVVVQNTTHLFNSTGTFSVILTVSDRKNSVQTTQLFVVNDTKAPVVQSVSYNAEHHLQRDGAVQTVSSALFDYSGVSNASLVFNAAQQGASCSATKTTMSCSWNLTGLVVGSASFMINRTDNFTSQHTASTTYTFSVTSCSDGVENGNEAGVDCGGSCSVSCSSSSDSGSSGGSGGSGGGGGGGGGGSSGGSSSSSGTTGSETVPEQLAPTAEPTQEVATTDTSVAQEDVATGVVTNNDASTSALTGGAVAAPGSVPSSSKKIALWSFGVLTVLLSSVYGVLRWRKHHREKFDWE